MRTRNSFYCDTRIYKAAKQAALDKGVKLSRFLEEGVTLALRKWEREKQEEALNTL